MLGLMRVYYWRIEVCDADVLTLFYYLLQFVYVAARAADDLMCAK